MILAKNKIGLSFEGLEEMAMKFDELGGDLKSVTTECLEKSHSHVTEKLHKDMKRHNRTGRTDKSIVDKAKVEWNGNTGSVDIGFDIHNGGLASIFLMHGTPRMKKDSRLYADVYGSKTRKEVQELQEEIFKKATDEIMGGE